MAQREDYMGVGHEYVEKGGTEMSKGGPGSWGKGEDPSHWGTVSNTESQTNYHVGKQGSGEHCHMWKEKDTGNAGVAHRGNCKVCDDGKRSGGK